MRQTDDLDYYARQSPITDPGPYRQLFDGLPHEIPEFVMSGRAEIASVLDGIFASHATPACVARVRRCEAGACVPTDRVRAASITWAGRPG